MAIIPSNPLKRLTYGLMRRSSRWFRASTDLFDDGFELQADWKSGIGHGGLLLHSLVRCIRPDVIVEIGSARGKSSCSLALGCRENGKGKVYAIDPHIPNPWSELSTSGNNEQFLRNRLKQYGLESFCEVVRDTSLNAAKTWKLPIDLIFIDGSHSYEGVKADFELFQPFFTEKTLVVFHDTAWDLQEWEKMKKEYHFSEDLGVPVFLEELRKAGYPSITLPVGPGMTILDPHVGGYDFVGSKGWAMMQSQ